MAQKQTKVYLSEGAPEPLVPPCDTWEEQLSGAARAEHPLHGWADDLGAPVSDAVDRVATAIAQGESIGRQRSQAVRIIRKVQGNLRHVNEAIEQHVPAHIQGMVQRVDVALLHVLSEAAGSPDSDLAARLAVGLEAVGDIPESGWWPAEDKLASEDFGEMDHAAWVRRLERLIELEARQPWRGDDVKAVWEKTLEERQKGLMHGPFTREQLDSCYGAGRWRPMQRFAVWQKGKLRACDNARASQHNEATSTHERLAVEGADFPARVALAFYERAAALGVPMWRMLSGTDDLQDAYRHVPSKSPEFTVVALWDPKAEGGGAVRYFTLPGFNFGLKSAVPQFNRVAEAATLVALELLGVVCCHFFDDFNVTEPAETAVAGQAALGELLRMIGIPFSEAKHVAAADKVLFLGVESDLSDTAAGGLVSMRVTEERIQRLGDMMESILEEDALFPSTAASLVGKLQFTLSWAFGRLGRAALQPLHAEMVVRSEGWAGGAHVQLVNRRARGFRWQKGDVDISRGGALGNPFPIAEGDSRDAVCDAWHMILFDGLNVEEARHARGLRAEPRVHGGRQEALRALRRRVANGGPLRLVCVCWPRRCHGLSIMQYLGAAPRRTPSQLTRGQRASLRFFCEVLPELKPHVIKLGGDGRRPVLVFSDARYEEDDESGYPAAVGFVVGIPNDGAPCGPIPSGSERAFLAEHYSWSHGSAFVPEAILAALLQRKQQIGQAELLGAIVPYLSMPSALAGREVLHWIDNTSAKAALVHGYSGLPDSVRLTHIFHAWNMGLEARVWFEYVPSAANPADEPSRVDLSAQRFVISRHPEIISHPTPVVFPPVARWRDPAGWAREAGRVRRMQR